MRENDEIIGNLLANNIISFLKKLEPKDRVIWINKFCEIFCEDCGEEIDYKLPYHKCEENGSEGGIV